MAEFGKVLIKVVNEEHDRAEWTHISLIRLSMISSLKGST